MSICMPKKNTLLYLDKNLVDAAKKHGLNISQLTENSIRSSLFPDLSRGQRIAMDFGKHLEDLEKEKKCFFLPFPLSRVEIRDIGPIESLKSDLGKLNAIIGSNGLGKSISIRSIAYLFGFGVEHPEHMVNAEAEKGEIKATVKSGKGTISANLEKGTAPSRPESGFGCILIDDMGAELDKKGFKLFLDYLKGLDSQVIFTTSIDISPLLEPEIKVINLNVLQRRQQSKANREWEEESKGKAEEPPKETDWGWGRSVENAVKVPKKRKPAKTI